MGWFGRMSCFPGGNLGSVTKRKVNECQAVRTTDALGATFFPPAPMADIDHQSWYFVSLYLDVVLTTLSRQCCSQPLTIQ